MIRSKPKSDALERMTGKLDRFRRSLGCGEVDQKDAVIFRDVKPPVFRQEGQADPDLGIAALFLDRATALARRQIPQLNDREVRGCEPAIVRAEFDRFEELVPG